MYLNWSFSREAPPSLVVSDTAGEAVETSAQAAEPITDPLVLETSAGADTQMMPSWRDTAGCLTNRLLRERWRNSTKR